MSAAEPTALSIIVPASDSPPTLDCCLAALEAGLGPDDELLVIRDGECKSPATARNVGAFQARNNVLVFVDADVTIHADALGRIRRAFAADPGLEGLFGAYDNHPPGPGIVAVFRNLLHHHVHCSDAGPAITFWSGLGAIRRSTFLNAGGFDRERYPRPMIEDVELGMRLSGSGHRIELRPEITGTHLKSWTLPGMIRSDFFDRGIPWTRLLLERGRRLPPVLNLGWRHRISAACVLAAPPAVAVGTLAGALPLMVLFVLLNYRLYALVARHHGYRNAPIAVALHGVHHVTAVAAVGAGVFGHVRHRWRRAASEPNQARPSPTPDPPACLPSQAERLPQASSSIGAT